jgi:hypothetical protein
MRCPRCNQDGLSPYTACSQCGFTGPAAEVEELGHVAYLLGELEGWPGLEPAIVDQVRNRYLRRRKELEFSLGLRPPPPSAEEAHKLRWQLHCLQQLRAHVDAWLAMDHITDRVATHLRTNAVAEADLLHQRLADARTGEFPAFDSPTDRLALVGYLIDTLNRLQSSFPASKYSPALEELLGRQRNLEIGLGLRPSPTEPKPTPAPVVVATAKAAEAPTAQVAEAPAAAPAVVARPPKPPRPPLTWERIWQTLLSERTLNVVLFLGAFLLVASATTYVATNWEALPEAIQLGFITLFTLSFYFAGWFLRVRMKLGASGIAVTAVGSLLVPLDFYAVFLAGGVLPAEQWPWVWLMASAVCLPIYTYTALRLRAEFFGYVVAATAGSLLCAALKVLGVAPEWDLLALTVLALGLLVLAYRLGASLLARPFRFSALVATAPILVVGFGWWLMGNQGHEFNISLAGAWTAGAILYAYAAIRNRDPWLGRIAATILPVAVLLLLRLAFEPLRVEPPWYALGWAVLGALYMVAGRRAYVLAGVTSADKSDSVAQAAESAGQEEPGTAEAAPAGDPALREHSHTATAWGLGLMAAAAVWAVFDLWAAAATHAVLAACVAMAVWAWNRPRFLPAVSLLALSSASFAMAAGHLEPAELGVGWSLLALLHVIAAVRQRARSGYATPLFAMALPIAGLAILPPLLLADEPLLTYAVGAWIGLAAWLLWLDHTREHSGLEALLSRLGPLRHTALHWAITLALPFFAALLYTHFRPLDAWLGIVLAILAWACFDLTHVPGFQRSALFRRWSLPWYVVGYGCSLAAPIVALIYYNQPVLAVTLFAAAVLYFASAATWRHSAWLIPGGLAVPAGVLLLLDFWGMPWHKQTPILALVPAAYLLVGLWLERRQGVPRRFMTTLYGVAHLLAAVTVVWGFVPAFRAEAWTGAAKTWPAGACLILGVAYALLAWFHEQEVWGHVATWLGVMAAGLAAWAYSGEHGSSALKVALLAVAYVLAERGLAAGAARRSSPIKRAWLLYRRPLLIAGWAVSGGAIALALGRNMWLLGGGLGRERWAIGALLTITALYAASAWLFRRRLFLWLAGGLVFVPWTLLTSWGWFVWTPPESLRAHALPWTILACLELFIGLALTFATGRTQSKQDYGFPLRVWANLLLPLALLWGVADSAISALTWGLGAAFYLLSAVADHRRGMTGWRAAGFLYPAVAVLPVWAVHLLHYAVPHSPYESYGLLLLALALPLLVVGRRLRRANKADALPFYLGAYGVAAIGTLLVGHRQPLLAAALTFDALLCILSAWLFRAPTWVYPATALAAGAMLIALAQSGVPQEHRGWWLIGLGAAYVAIAWLLRRLKQPDYAAPSLVAAFVVITLGLSASSVDDVGAFWGYLGAALIYAVVAAWLCQPLLLTPAAALLAVPYGVALIWLEVDPADYGLALFPGVAVALTAAHLLDWRMGRSPALFPSWHPRTWRPAVWLDWWAGPAYAWGYVGALAAAGLSWGDPTRLAIALTLAAAAFLHATWRFRKRAALLLAGALAQGAALAVIDAAGWLLDPSWAALAFLPVTVITAALALVIEHLRGEGSPLGRAWWAGWSRPFYLLLAIDLLAGQAAALIHSEPGAAVTAVHALLLTLLATVWAQPVLPFAAAGLGVVALFQALTRANVEPTGYPVGMALLGLGYGLLGYGLWGVARLVSAEGVRRRAQVWIRPLEWIGVGLCTLALLAALVVSLDVADLIIRTVLGRPLTVADYAPQVRMMMWVLALGGLLYLATAFVRRRRLLGYVAVALLLAGWALWWRFFVAMAQFQWYAIPAGLYLLAIGWLEWRAGNKALARWVDRAGMLVWLGSAWVQSLPGVSDRSWPFALIMGVEALLLVWWGSARRQRQFLYVGLVAVVVDAVTQSIEPLLTVNRWIVFGVAGLLLVGLAVLIERRVDKIRELSAEMRARLETWE